MLLFGSLKGADLFILLGISWRLFLIDIEATLVLHIGTIWVWKELEDLGLGADFVFAFAHGCGVEQT